MRKIFLYLFVLFLTLWLPRGSLAAETRLIKVGAFNNYPVIFKDTDGRMKGMYVDLLSEIGKKENINFKYVFGTWGEGLERIKTGEVDLLTSVGYTEERLAFMDYPKTPVLMVWGELYALPSTEIDSILKVVDKKIGVMSGDINAKNFFDKTSDFGVFYQAVEFGSYDEVFKAIREKTVDAGVAGITFGMANISKYGLKSTGVVFNPLNLYFTTAKDKNQDLLLVIDRYLTEWKAADDSIYYQTKAKWMGGTVNTVTVIPKWLTYFLVGLGAALLVAMVFIILLKLQVNRVTGRIFREMEVQRRSREKWQTLFESSSEALVTLGKPEWKFVLVNSAAIKLFGAESASQLSSYSPAELSPERQPDGRLSSEKAIEMIERAVVEGSNLFEWKHKKINGEEFFAEIYLTYMELEGGGFLKATIRDIDERKKLEAELIESKNVLQAKIDELEKVNELTVGREMKMVELKEEIEKLKKKK